MTTAFDGNDASNGFASVSSLVVHGPTSAPTNIRLRTFDTTTIRTNGWELGVFFLPV
jgi:hypothetical protein